MRSLSAWRAGINGGLAIALLVASGCSAKPTLAFKTFSVKGRVVYKDGEPVKGGMIEFRPTDASASTAFGEIREDGTFTLSTTAGSQRVAGAAAGEYSVTVMPGVGEAQSSDPPIALPKPSTVKPDDSNDLTITVERPKRRS